MMIYRIKQFYWGIEALFISDDFKILNKYLNDAEISLFKKLSKAERYHSIRVCRHAMNYINDRGILDIDKHVMGKCALLHDIGKIEVEINILYKSIITILNSITGGKYLKYNKSKRIFNYYNHPQIGVELLKKIGVENLELINCIKYHHTKNIIEKNIYLDILLICDNSN